LALIRDESEAQQTNKRYAEHITESIHLYNIKTLIRYAMTMNQL